MEKGEMTGIRAQGMKCQYCAANAQKALEEIDGIGKVAVDLDAGEITYEGDAPREAIRVAIEGRGYRLEE